MTDARKQSALFLAGLSQLAETSSSSSLADLNLFVTDIADAAIADTK